MKFLFLLCDLGNNFGIKLPPWLNITRMGGIPFTAHGAQIPPPLFLIYKKNSCFYDYFG